MPVEIPVEEQIHIIRSSLVALLSRDPHCPFAQVLGQTLMDLYEDL